VRSEVLSQLGCHSSHEVEEMELENRNDLRFKQRKVGGATASQTKGLGLLLGLGLLGAVNRLYWSVLLL
jgi:lipoate-protein ligase A